MAQSIPAQHGPTTSSEITRGKKRKIVEEKQDKSEVFGKAVDKMCGDLHKVTKPSDGAVNISEVRRLMNRFIDKVNDMTGSDLDDIPPSCNTSIYPKINNPNQQDWSKWEALVYAASGSINHSKCISWVCWPICRSLGKNQILDLLQHKYVQEHLRQIKYQLPMESIKTSMNSDGSAYISVLHLCETAHKTTKCFKLTSIIRSAIDLGFLGTKDREILYDMRNWKKDDPRLFFKIEELYKGLLNVFYTNSGRSYYPGPSH